MTCLMAAVIRVYSMGCSVCPSLISYTVSVGVKHHERRSGCSVSRIVARGPLVFIGRCSIFLMVTSHLT